MNSFAAQFRMIVRDYERLKVKELEAIDCWHEMERLHQRIEKLLEEVRHWSAVMEHELQGRWDLQQLVRKTDLNGDALKLFWNDQLVFYENWLSKWIEQMDVDSRRCVVNMSMRKVLMLLRLARDVDIVPNAPLKYAFVFITKHLRTVHQEQISYESIRKKYSQLDEATISEVEILLHACLDKIAIYKKDLHIK